MLFSYSESETQRVAVAGADTGLQGRGPWTDSGTRHSIDPAAVLDVLPLGVRLLSRPL